MVREWLTSAIDYVRYTFEEVRNVDRDRAWGRDEMTKLMTATALERDTAEVQIARRNFWKTLASGSLEE